MKVELRQLSKAYFGKWALRDLSVEVVPGQLVALLGPNGAGKTTLLRCLSGILAPDKGEICYDGERFHRGRIDLRRRFMFLPDTPAPSPAWDLTRQIGLVIELYDKNRKGIEDRVVELLHDFDLVKLVDQPLAMLSRGQAYKAALVALLAVDPELWLLDEPLASGMDPHGIMALKRHVRAAVERGRSIIYSTQILDVVESFADRVCILHEGCVHAFGPMQELRGQSGNGERSLEEIFSRLREES